MQPFCDYALVQRRRFSLVRFQYTSSQHKVGLILFVLRDVAYVQYTQERPKQFSLAHDSVRCQ